MQQEKKSIRWQIISVLAVLAIALFVRLQTAANAQNIAPDGTVFLQMARQFTEASPKQVALDYQYHPGYPAVIAALASIIKPSWPDGWIVLGQAVAIAASLLTLAMIYLFARKAFDHVTALLAVLLLGLSSEFTQTSSDVLSDSLAVSMAMLALVLALKAREALAEGKWQALTPAALTGLAAGAGYLTRPEELLPAGIAAILLIFTPCRDRRCRIIQLSTLATLAIATLLCVAPYAFTIGGFTQKKNMADFVWSGQAGMILAHMNSSGEGYGALLRVIDRGRTALGTPVTITILISLTTYIGKYILRLKVPASIVIAPARWPAIAIACSAAVMAVLLTSLEHQHSQYISARHTMLMVFPLAPFAGSGMLILTEWTVLAAGRLKGRLTRAVFTGGKLSAAIAIVLIRLFKGRPQVAAYFWLAVFVVCLLPHALPTLHADKGCFRQAGLYIKQTYGPGHYVLSNDGWAPFYAESPARQFMKDCPHLLPADTTTQESLWARVADGPVKYEFMVLNQDACHRDPKILRDPRYVTIKSWLSGDKEAVLLKVQPPASAPAAE